MIRIYYMAGEEKKISENVIPLFPIPNVVLLPKIRMPLLVFEEKYKKLVFDVVASSGILAIFSLKSGYITRKKKSEEGEEDKLAPSMLYPIGCAGRIISFSETAQNIYTVTVEGLFRVKVIDVVKDEEPYQKVRFEILQDILPPVDVQEELRKELISVASQFMLKIGENPERVKEIVQIAHNMRFDEVVNWAVFLHPLKFKVKQGLLEEDELEKRARIFIEEVKKDIKNIEILENFRHLKPKDPRVN